MNLPSDIVTNICEYTPRDYIVSDVPNIVARIRYYDPSFSLAHILQDRKRDIMHREYIRGLYAYDLYHILAADSPSFIHLYEDAIIDLPEEKVEEVLERYPEASYDPETDRVTFPAGKNVVTELYIIHYVTNRYHKRMPYRYYTNRAFSEETPYAWGDPDISAWKAFIFPTYVQDRRDDMEIYGELISIDSSFSISLELCRTIEDMKVKNTTGYKLWLKARDMPWRITLDNDTYVLEVGEDVENISVSEGEELIRADVIHSRRFNVNAENEGLGFDYY